MATNGDRLVMFDRGDLKESGDRLVCRCRCVDNHPLDQPPGGVRGCALFVEAGDVCPRCAELVATAARFGKGLAGVGAYR